MKKTNAETRPHLLQNAAMVDDTIIVSRHVHDYVECKGFAIDGGLEYQRIAGEMNCPRFVNLAIYSDMPVEEYADRVVWGTRGKDGTEEFRFVLLKGCSNGHLIGILETQKRAAQFVKDAVCFILHRRALAMIGMSPEYFIRNNDKALEISKTLLK